MTNPERHEAILEALREEGETVTRYIAIYETATGDSFAIQQRSSDDAPWILLGMVDWSHDALMDEARGRDL